MSLGTLIKAAGMEFGEAYLYGTAETADDTPFAKLKTFDLKIATAIKEAMGPEQYVAVGVGISDRKFTADFTVETYSLKRYKLLLGGAAPTVVTGGFLYESFGYDSPLPFNIHLVNPIDASGRSLILYGAICVDISNSMKLRDWTSEKLTCHLYGDNSVSPAKMMAWTAPSDFE